MHRLVWIIALCLGLQALAAPALAQEEDLSADDEADDGSWFEPEFNEALSEAKTPRERARAHFRMGVEFYKERDFRAALIEFKRAQEVSPHFKVLFNLAQVSLELQDYVGAIDYLDAYLEQGGEQITPAQRAEVDAMMARLSPLIGELTISVNEGGAELFIDNSPVGISPLNGPVRVSAGRIKVTAIKTGRQLYERHLDVAPGEHKEVELVLAPIREETPETAPLVSEKATVEVHASGGGVSAALVTGILTGALGIGAGVMVAVTMKAENKYNDTRLASTPTTNAELADLRNDAKVKAWVTDGLLGATLVSAIVTTVLAITDDNDEPAALSFDLSPDRVGVSGTF